MKSSKKHFFKIRYSWFLNYFFVENLQEWNQFLNCTLANITPLNGHFSKISDTNRNTFTYLQIFQTLSWVR